ncbi:MAG TPA: cation:proton antiporter subunit C [Candidatus Corynebacterium gallistercoris]|uniref:Cation:proton antiporter subunit C n=1 Tax=Candidatus Corynebacterium gallistercoris TaxID=2838530 RepID=A0A9D1RY50_9CORY|nr:cation:proton antiporter subunit C [Candidatus Corynebacterium gallistercoris]
MIIAAIIAILTGGGVYLIMQRGMLRLIMGVTLLTHAVNLLILAAGIGAWRTEPIMDRATAGEAADPLPQAFVLTAIVISMAASAVMLAMAALGRDDDTRGTDDPERAQRKFRVLQTMGSGPDQPKAQRGRGGNLLGVNDHCELHSPGEAPHKIGEDK